MNKYKEEFEFLNELRESGEINMMFAPTKLVHKFGFSKKQAIEIFNKWTESLKN